MMHHSPALVSNTPVRMMANQLEAQLKEGHQLEGQLASWGGSVSRSCLSRACSRGDVLNDMSSDLQLLIPDRDHTGAAWGQCNA